MGIANLIQYLIGEVYIAVELCPNGNIQSFLLKRRDEFVNFVEYGILKNSGSNKDKQCGSIGLSSHDSLTTLTLFQWTLDIAKGLSYLSEKHVIHGDLATRNVLLTEDLRAKIGDFGLARQLVNSSNYVKKSQVSMIL
jgi:serine/threonine protein kinase